jgi:hypothetical protein
MWVHTTWATQASRALARKVSRPCRAPNVHKGPSRALARLRPTPAKRQHHLACAVRRAQRGLRCAAVRALGAQKSIDALRASGATSEHAHEGRLMLCGPRSRASWSPSGGPRRPLGSAAPARDVGDHGFRLARPLALVRLRPTPAKLRDRLERSRACGLRPQSVETVSTARGVAADACKVSRPSHAPASCPRMGVGECIQPSRLGASTHATSRPVGPHPWLTSHTSPAVSLHAVRLRPGRDSHKAS